jgi:hypothetical protein
VETFTAPQLLEGIFEDVFPPYPYENSSKLALGSPRTIVTNTSYEANVSVSSTDYNLTNVWAPNRFRYVYCYRNLSDWVYYEGLGDVILQLGWLVNIYYEQSTNRSGNWTSHRYNASYGLDTNKEVILLIIKHTFTAYKPAIHLYPQEPLDVMVSLDVAGSMFYSDPPYPQDGWHVTAYPGGCIDGKYDYLYYDAILDDIEFQPEGWVIEPREIGDWCNATLPGLGLASNEIAEFTSFWNTRLPDAPFVRVSLLSDAFLSENLALTVTPRPDVVIRRIFVLAGIEQTASIPEPVIETPARAGFTVVEWGGIPVS